MTICNYPLLQNNTAWFIVADFDEENRQQESLVYPFTFGGKLNQYIGRIQRSGKIINPDNV